VPLRRALLKIHLWLALAVGLYVIVISVSGSAVIFRPEVNRWAVPRVDDATGVTSAVGTAEAAQADINIPISKVQINKTFVFIPRTPIFSTELTEHASTYRYRALCYIPERRLG
jgi:hypothetical protein